MNESRASCCCCRWRVTCGDVDVAAPLLVLARLAGDWEPESDAFVGDREPRLFGVEGRSGSLDVLLIGRYEGCWRRAGCEITTAHVPEANQILVS
jgi:hypothetical protein